MNINKQELITMVAEESGLTKKATAATIKALAEVITDRLANGDEVTIYKVGKFYVHKRNPRLGVNPRNTSERFTIPSRNVPKFRPATSLKRAVEEE